MKNILLIGVGGTGSNAVDILYQQIKEFGNQTDNHITALVFDTDVGSVKSITTATTVPMADNASVGTICDRIGVQYLKEWFPCDETSADYKSVRAQEMVRGASQWRKKSFLAFLNLMNKPMARSSFISALEKMVVNPGASCEVYVIASVAGGTGSGSFIPIALYAQRYLRKCLGKDPIVNAMIALPDIYADSQTPDNKVKIYANAYAILRELNAINLVAHNYNDMRNEEKKAMVRFRIGHPDEPNVGVLFDSMDKQYWTPEAAPFSQIFILDRIPGLKSVQAHDIVMANALYAIICTDIGAAFDSEASNHAVLHSQSNGSNAIYAGISTSQIRFPKETILDYLARKKALNACESEWMVLHRAVEAQISEKVQIAKDNNDKYVMGDGEYAQLMLNALEEQEMAGANISVVDMVDRGTALRDEEGRKTGKSTEDTFFKVLSGKIEERLPDADAFFNDNKEKSSVESAKSKETVVENAQAFKEDLLEYFAECVETIKRSSTNISESVLTFDERRDPCGNATMSLVTNLLKKDGRFIHPVAAMVQLCRFKKHLHEFLAPFKSDYAWTELKKRTVDDLPQWAMEFDNEDLPSVSDDRIINGNRSAYLKVGDLKQRFAIVCNDPDEYLNKRTDARSDNACVTADAQTLLRRIRKQAITQLKYSVFTRLSKSVDMLIDKYRSFFSRFEKEKEDLIEETKTVLRKDAGAVDSVINVYSSMEDKAAILKEVFDNAGPENDAQVAETDGISGLGVFTTAYGSAVAACQENDNFNEKDSHAYRSLFTNMVSAYREYIARADAFDKIASYNVIQAIEASAKDQKEREDALRACFSTAQELATPSLRIDTTEDESDLVLPSNILVFMMSLETGKYIKKRADAYGLHMPADQTKERAVVQACAEEFIRRYSGNDSVRVSIVSNMPDCVLYCTGEIMDISPLRIAKFDELGTDNAYFRNYTEALRRFKVYNTDMWNPHIGKDLHRRGYLPYMNAKMEDLCDERMVKALLYALNHGEITYKASGLAQTNRVYSFRYLHKGEKKPILGMDGNMVQIKNVAQLVAWLRNEDDLIDNWSRKFDADIQAQLNALPHIASDSEVPRLEAAMTSSDFMTRLRTCLFEDPSRSAAEAQDEDATARAPKNGPGILELAYLVKTSEESSKDCDDAERILRVAYQVFLQFCTFRAKPDVNPERFIQVYRQQIGRLFLGLAKASMFGPEVGDRKAYFNQFVSWLNYADTFRNIPLDSAMDEKGEVCINANFDFEEYSDIALELGRGKARGAKAKAADTAVADDNA